MTEIAHDPTPANGQPTEAPAKGGPRSEMGMGLLEPDKAAGDLEPRQGQPGADSEAPSEGDTATDAQPKTTAPPDDIEELRRGYLRQQDYSRKTMDLGEQRRQLQEELQRFQQERNQFLQQQRQWFQQAQQGGGQQADPLQALAAQLSPEEARGLQVVDQLMAERIKAALEREVGPLRQFREQMEQQFRQTSSTVEQLTQQQRSALLERITNEVTEAKTLFGEEQVQASAGFVKRNMEEVNPATGKRYTVAELVAMATGKSLEEARQARQQNRQQRGQAKRGASTTGATHAGTTSNGTISKSQALAEIAATM